jgi:hypothetical protein
MDSTATDGVADAPDALDGTMRLNTVTPLVGTTGRAGRGIIADSMRLYWVDLDTTTGNGSLYSAPKSGGSFLVKATNQPGPLDVAGDDDFTYWSLAAAPSANNCLVMGLDKSNGNMGCIAAGSHTTARMALGSGVFAILSKDTAAVTGNPFIGFAKRMAGTTAPYTAVPALGPGQALAITSTDLFVSDDHGIHIDVFSFPNLQPAGNVCNITCGDKPIVDMTPDVAGTNMLWATTDGQVFSAPIAPPEMPGTLLGTVSGSPQRIARDAFYVYVTSDSGSVTAIPLAGGNAVPLARGQPSPFGIAVDPVNVYWTNGDGSVRGVGVPPPPP